MKNNVVIITCLIVISFCFLGTILYHSIDESKMSSISKKSQKNAITNSEACNKPNKTKAMKKKCEKDLTLYISPSCPFCVRVLDYMKKHNIKIAIKDRSDPANKAYLMKHGGKSQVPCLFIKDQALYESSDIITYLATIFDIK